MIKCNVTNNRTKSVRVTPINLLILTLYKTPGGRSVRVAPAGISLGPPSSTGFFLSGDEGEGDTFPCFS